MNQKGFTVIELLVSIGILLIMFGVGLVNYLGFRDEQKLTQSKNMVKEAVIDAQSSARSGRLFGCGQLAGYRILMSGSSIVLSPVCSAGSSTYTDIYDLPGGVTFYSAGELFAQAVNGIIDEDTDPHTGPREHTTVQLDLNGTRESICIDKTGTVSDGACP